MPMAFITKSASKSEVSFVTDVIGIHHKIMFEKHPGPAILPQDVQGTSSTFIATAFCDESLGIHHK